MHLWCSTARLSPRRVSKEEPLGDMKKHTRVKPPRSTKYRKSFNQSPIRGGQDLNHLANEMHALAHKFLRDGVLQGTLSGQEGEIRNDAVLLALEWFVKSSNPMDMKASGAPRQPWHLPRALAAALKVVKLRHARLLTNAMLDTEPLNEMNGGSTPHYSDIAQQDWPEAVKQEVLRRGINAAVVSGRITHANACIARLVFIKYMPVSHVAERRNVDRSAIYQHLWRVRDAMPEILETVEVPTII